MIKYLFLQSVHPHRQMRENKYYIVIYVLSCKIIFHVILPIIILGTLNFLTYTEMRNLKERYTHIKDIHEHETRRIQIHMAELNLVIAILFVIFHSIHVIPSICEIKWVSEFQIMQRCQFCYMHLTNTTPYS